MRNDIPLLHELGCEVAHDAAIVVVPAHLRELPRDGIVAKDRVPRCWRRAI